jgi:sigma-E factor negative regulatory protein RseC
VSNCAIGDEGNSRLIEVQNPLAAEVGEHVRIATTTKSFLQSSFLLYIVPLIALVIGAVAGMLVGENLPTGLDPNLLSAIFGVFFMSGSFVILRVGSSVLNKESYMPKIIEILKEES